MNLETLLQQLAALAERVQQIWEVLARADEDNEIDEDYEFDFEGEHQMWLTLERDINGVWECGWRMRPDEATEWAVHQAGHTPLEAAGLLLALIEAQPEAN